MTTFNRSNIYKSLLVGLATLLISLIYTPQARAATGVSNVTFSTQDTGLGDENATWSVSFVTSSAGALSAGSGTISIFAAGEVLPFYPGAYRINGTPVSAAPITSPGEVTLVTPVSIANQANVNVVITGIINQTSLTNVPNTDYWVDTSADSTQVSPTAGQNFTSQATGVNFSFSNNGAGVATSTWTINFLSPASGPISYPGGTITIEGPVGTTFPSLIGDYAVNSTPVTNPVVLTSPNVVTIDTPISIPTVASTTVSIKGVTNPGTLGQSISFSPADFMVYTSASTDPVAIESPDSNVVFSAIYNPVQLSFTVNNQNDTADVNPGSGICSDAVGRCSLRAAIMEANADPMASVNIYLPAGTFNLSIPPIFDQTDGSNGALFISSSSHINIVGASPSTTLINAEGPSGAFQDKLIQIGSQADVDISNVTLENGVNNGSSSELDGCESVTIYCQGGGGAITNLGRLVLNNDVITNNLDSSDDFQNGGAIYNATTAELFLNDTTVSNNTEAYGNGGALECFGKCTANYSTFNSNSSANDGGAIDIQGNLTLEGSSLVSNTSNNMGGGAIACDNVCNIINTTFGQNKETSTLAFGGAIFCDFSCQMTMYFSTIYENSSAGTNSGGGLYLEGYSSAPILTGDIIAGNSNGNCGFSSGLGLNDLGYNLSSDTSCNLGASGDISSTDPLLQSIALNGGPTENYLPSSTSPAIDTIPASNCVDLSSNPLNSDQRGFLRPVIGKSGGQDYCDMGSVEYNSNSYSPSEPSNFNGLTPYRVCDTRSSSKLNQCTAKTLGPNGQLDLQVLGFGGVPDSGVVAVVLNVTAINGSSNGGYLTIWPAGFSRPTASSINWSAGEIIANSVTVEVGYSGEISLYNAIGSVDVAVDIEGYYSVTGLNSGLFNPVAPTRVCDTRVGSPANQCNYNGQKDGYLGPNSVMNVQIAGQLSGGQTAVPLGSSSVVLNVTAVNTTGAGGYLTIWPQGQVQPLASNLNFGPSDAIPNRVIVPISSTGYISIYNYSGDTDVIVDVNGYFTGINSLGSGHMFYGISPNRVCDTRSSSGLPPCTGKTLSGGTSLDVAVAGVSNISSSAVSMDANVTVTNTTAWSYLTIYPENSSFPTASDLNWTSGGITIANQTITELGTSGGISVYNAFGSVDVIMDVDGFYK
jgi:CSLREA domain-containing protein